MLWCTHGPGRSIVEHCGRPAEEGGVADGPVPGQGLQIGADQGVDALLLVVGVEVAEWEVKKMKTKWGTCNIEKKRIWINLELAKKPIHCLEYIIVHEMVHLLERYHNDRFKAYMDEFLPNWKSIRDELNEMIYESSQWTY